MRNEFKPVDSVSIPPLTDAREETEDSLAASHDAEFEKLTASVEAGVARNRRIACIVFEVESLRNTIGIGLTVMVGRWISPSHQWGPMLEACLVAALANILCHRLVLNVAFPLWVRLTQRKLSLTAIRLMKRNDVRAVPLLIDALQWTDDPTLRKELWAGSGRLLLRLNEEEAQQIGSERAGILATWMKSWDKRPIVSDKEPLLGMLHVMAFIGAKTLKTKDRNGITSSVSLLPLLERWASGREAGQDPAVQQAAIACRKAIQAKIALALSDKQLLRASSPVTGSTEALLRPAQELHQADPQKLLRAAQGKEMSGEE